MEMHHGRPIIHDWVVRICHLNEITLYGKPEPMLCGIWKVFVYRTNYERRISTYLCSRDCTRTLYIKENRLCCYRSPLSRPMKPDASVDSTTLGGYRYWRKMNHILFMYSYPLDPLS